MTPAYVIRATFIANVISTAFIFFIFLLELVKIAFILKMASDVISAINTFTYGNGTSP